MRQIRNLVVFATILASTAHAEDVTIAALGDSLTQGYGLAPDAGFVSQLGRWLEDKGQSAILINAGVSGDTTAGGLARVDWTLTDEIDALIVALGGNDVLRGLDPADSKANLAGILDIAKSKGVKVLLVGMVAPANYGPEFKTEFDTMYSELATEFGTLLHPDFLRALTAETDLATALATFMQPDGIHPNADGVALIVEDIGPSVVELIDRTNP